MAPRFLFIISGYPPLRRGGMELSCQRLASALVRRGHPVTVLTLAAPDLPGDAVEDGVRVRRVISPWEKGPLWGVKYSLDVGTWMKRLEDDWDFALCFQLYLHSSVAVTVAGTMKRKVATRLANSGPGGDLDKMRAMRLGDKAVRHALRADALFPLSDAGARELHALKVPPDRLWRMPVFVDGERFAPPPVTPSPVFHWHGRFVRSKNLPLLLRAFEAVHAAHPGARLQLAGDGGERPALEAAVAASPARGAVDLVPWTDRPEIPLARALATVSASGSEGLSNTLLESLACGVPVVATDVSGARDLLDPEGLLPATVPAGGFLRARHGLLVPPDDVGSLAAAMGALLSDAQLRPSLAEGLADEASARFSEDAAVASFLNAANAIMEGRPSTPAERGFRLGLFEAAGDA